jgi:hypothetical protein
MVVSGIAFFSFTGYNCPGASELFGVGLEPLLVDLVPNPPGSGMPEGWRKVVLSVCTCLWEL